MEFNLSRRPTVHELCMPAFLQETIRLSDTVVATPVDPFGTAHVSDYLVRYARVLGIDDAPAAPQGKHRWPSTGPLPVTALILTFPTEFPPDRVTLEAAAEPHFRLARRLLSLVTGDDTVPFATLVLPPESVAGWASVRSSRERVRIGDANTGDAFQAQVTAIASAAERDDRFAFALGLFQDAVRETDFQARAARLFNCLEALLPLNPRNATLTAERKTRAEVKYMLGFETDILNRVSIARTQFTYDPVELGGRMRDHLYHGTPIRPGDLRIQAGDSDRLVFEYPHVIANDLEGLCAQQIARTAERFATLESP